MNVLATITTLTNLLALAISLWLGFYIVTRSPWNPTSWLAALTLWALTSFFAHNTLMINVPGSGILPWLRAVVVLILPLWFHLTVRMLPPRTRRRIWYHLPLRLPEPTRQPARALVPFVRRFWIHAVYTVALVLMLIGGLPLAGTVYLSDRQAGPLYPYAILFLIVLWILSLANLWQGRAHAENSLLKRQFTLLAAGTALAGAGGLYLGLGVWFGWRVPAVLGDAAVGISVVFLGIAVARHSALVEAQAIKRDFRYTTMSIAILTMAYLVVAVLLYRHGHLSFLALILTLIGTVSSHALYDGVRSTVDRVFYKEQLRQLRTNLSALAREAGSREPLPDQLESILAALCHALRVRKGFIALLEDSTFVVRASRKMNLADAVFPLPALSATEIGQPPASAPRDLQAMALLVPLHTGGEQVGVVAVGPKRDNQPFDEQDLVLLDDLAGSVAAVIQTAHLQEENAAVLNEMVADFRQRERALQRQVQELMAQREEEAKPVLGDISQKELISLVEDALRRLHDFSYLGQHALADLGVVAWQLDQDAQELVTHIDRGKALHEILLQALEKLRPVDEEPDVYAVPPREWYQYMILHDSYVLDKLNRDVMSRLYISEGTFNRTRRRAVRALAWALREMEQAVM
jgi:hypothetical protein